MCLRVGRTFSIQVFAIAFFRWSFQIFKKSSYPETYFERSQHTSAFSFRQLFVAISILCFFMRQCPSFCEKQLIEGRRRQHLLVIAYEKPTQAFDAHSVHFRKKKSRFQNHVTNKSIQRKLTIPLIKAKIINSRFKK